jgi:quaternary ammonium compound-resistance protein SugE
VKGAFYITIGGILEIVWAISMSYSEGFTDPLWSVNAVVFIILSMVMLSKAMGAGMPMGTAYAAWVGIGAVGTFAYSAMFMDEPLDLIRIFFVGLLIIGIIGLQKTSESSA